MKTLLIADDVSNDVPVLPSLSLDGHFLLYSRRLHFPYSTCSRRIQYSAAIAAAAAAASLSSIGEKGEGEGRDSGEGR